MKSTKTASKKPHREFPIVTEIRKAELEASSTGKAYKGPMCSRLGKDRMMIPCRGTVSARQAAHHLVQAKCELPIVVIDYSPWKGKAKHKIVVC